MLTFTGEASTLYPGTTPQELFAVATNVQTLSAWVVAVENVRVVGGGKDLGLHVRFLADAALADKPDERNLVYEVTAWNAGREFAFRALDGPPSAGAILLNGTSEGVEAAWSYTGGPTALMDKLMCSLFSASMRGQASRQAGRELERLRTLSVEATASRQA